MIRTGLAGAAVRRDQSGNPALDKSRWDARIDVVSAAVIAAGLRSLARRADDGRPSYLIAGAG